MTPRSFGVNCDRSKLTIYIKVLVFTVLLSKNQKKLFIAFYSQINGQIERQNSIMEVYLKAFVN